MALHHKGSSPLSRGESPVSSETRVVHTGAGVRDLIVVISCATGKHPSLEAVTAAHIFSFLSTVNRFSG